LFFWQDSGQQILGVGFRDSTCGAGVKHKAWGAARLWEQTPGRKSKNFAAREAGDSGNGLGHQRCMETKVDVAPRLMLHKRYRPLRGLKQMAHSSLGFARKASLHPRLYADTCFAG